MRGEDGDGWSSPGLEEPLSCVAWAIPRWRELERRGGTRERRSTLTTVVVLKASEAARSMYVVSLTSSFNQKDSSGMELVLKYSSILATLSNHKCWILQPDSSTVILKCCEGEREGGGGG